LFYGGAFWNRCRPGLSHSAKRGLPFRAAGMKQHLNSRRSYPARGSRQG
jgi:hypothetical protein